MDLLEDEEERRARLRQRLWGAAVLIAILVIVLPLVLDGSGSESQFRRVERLREEPPRIVGADGQPEVTAPTGPDIRIGEDDPPDYMRERRVEVRSSEPGPRTGPRAGTGTSSVFDNLTAWVVQAGSFADEANALAVRDRLRRAGHPSFVTPQDDGGPPYRVRVGPMIDEAAARRSRDAVVTLLGREAIVTSYP